MTDYRYTYIKTMPDLGTGPDPRTEFATVQDAGEYKRFIYEHPDNPKDFIAWAAHAFEDNCDLDLWVTIPDPARDDWESYHLTDADGELAIQRD